MQGAGRGAAPRGRGPQMAEAEAERAARAASWVVPPAGVWSLGQGVRAETARMYRLARMTRAGRGL